MALYEKPRPSVAVDVDPADVTGAYIYRSDDASGNVWHVRFDFTAADGSVVSIDRPLSDATTPTSTNLTTTRSTLRKIRDDFLALEGFTAA